MLALELRSFTLCVADTGDVLSGRVMLLRAPAEENQRSRLLRRGPLAYGCRSYIFAAQMTLKGRSPALKTRSRRPSLQMQAACSMPTDARSLSAWSMDATRQEIVW